METSATSQVPQSKRKEKLFGDDHSNCRGTTTRRMSVKIETENEISYDKYTILQSTSPGIPPMSRVSPAKKLGCHPCMTLEGKEKICENHVYYATVDGTGILHVFATRK